MGRWIGEAGTEGYRRWGRDPSVSRQADCHLPIWLRKMERTYVALQRRYRHTPP